MNKKPTKTKPKKLEVFEVWKEYEQIAMHFNELLMQLRMRALGGVAAISALVGILSKGDTAADFRWGIVSAVLLAIAVVWIAVWIIDTKYYTRLLYGSVRAVLEIEKISRESRIVRSLEMSHRIKESVEGDFSGLDKNPVLKSAVSWFYALVLFILLAGAYLSLDEHCTSAAGTPLTHSHDFCRAVQGWHSISP